MDWKDMLGELRDSGMLPEGSDPAPAQERSAEKRPADRLHIVVERKGRKGKTATIIEGFTCSDDKLESIAADLKKRLGTGGSARGGEILIQGDYRQRIADILTDLGYRMKS
ncbi:MAG: translation initiation factor [Muribaculaceae bacterium]|nr:translation initiation factor [Muribaculaceae bacterium]